MKFSKLAMTAAAVSCVAACGGSNDGAGTGPDTPPAGATTYAQGTPAVGATDVFVTAKVDESANTINGSFTQRVASVGADGSYTLTQLDPSGTALVVNGIDYHFDPATLNFDGQGHETSVDVTLENGATQACTFTPQSGGHASPWWVGQSYAQTVQENCTPGSLELLTLSGAVVALESVTVPAGTFMALKLQSTESWTDANGQSVTENVIHWVDPAHSLFTIKTQISYIRGGVVPAHHVNSQTIELQSRSST
jgi:hypothetical protein